MGRPNDDDDPGAVQPQGRPSAQAATTATTPSVVSVSDGAVNGYGDAGLLALSDERDLHLRRLLAAEAGAYERGYREGRADGEAAGYIRAVEQFKRAQHEAVEDLQLHLTRWDGLRERFGDPRPGDFPGRQVKAA